MTIFEPESMFDAVEDGPQRISRSAVPPVSALEAGFPAEMISAAAERESWRKEIHRPATHTHKWWAQRLGSVFRGILAAAVAEGEQDAMDCYSSALRLPGLVVCDPFAGSGTTLAEAAKLGAKVVGRDINPVATLVQRQALAPWDRTLLDAAFKKIESQVRERIDALHRNKDGLPVLYYFWVALASCPQCPADAAPVELFSRYVFAQHAYPKKHPTSRATCPHCHAVVVVNVVEDSKLTCHECGETSGISGPVNRATMTCPSGHASKVLDALGDQPPALRMYAKQVLYPDGTRRYESIDEFDRALYAQAERCLADGRGSWSCQLVGWMTATIPGRPSGGTIEIGLSSSMRASSTAWACSELRSAIWTRAQNGRPWLPSFRVYWSSIISSARSRERVRALFAICSPIMY